jgi:hypothetical protein
MPKADSKKAARITAAPMYAEEGERKREGRERDDEREERDRETKAVKG